MDESTTFKIPPNQHDYYSWRILAQQNGLHHKIAQAYYDQRIPESLYTYSVGENHYTAPVLSTESWMSTRKPNQLVRSFNSDQVIDFNLEELKKSAKATAFAQNETTGRLDQFIWNNPTYGVSKIASQTSGLDIQLSDYYSVRTTAAKLREELFEEAYYNNIDPTSSLTEIKQNFSKLNLEYRNWNYNDEDSFIDLNTLRLAGQTTVSVLHTENEKYIPIEIRSSQVSESPGWRNPIPNGSLQPYTKDSSEIEYPQIIFDKFIEEVCNNTSEISVQQFMSSYQDNGIELDILGYGVDIINGYVHIYNLLQITDVDLSNQILSTTDQSWRSDAVDFFNIKNKPQFTAFLDPSVTIPYNVIALSEAFQALSDQGVDHPIEISRNPLYSSNNNF